jgi:Tol biopolymer transport system component
MKLFRLLFLLSVPACFTTLVSSAQAQRVTDENQQQNNSADRISYVSFRPGNWDLYYFPKPGSTPRRLTSHPDLDYDPAISPDGRWVVFCAERKSNPDLYVLDLKMGGEPRKLIESPAMEDQPSFSPDGKTLLFVSSLSGNADVYSIPFNPQRVQSMAKAKNLTNHPGGDFRPTFSPDGRYIAFSTDRDTPPTGWAAGRKRAGEIYSMNLDGGNLKRLTHSPDWDGSPAWSANGKTIYFYARRKSEQRIWAMDSDGNNQRTISPKGLLALSPAPMNEGRVLFTVKTEGKKTRNRGDRFTGNWQLMSVREDGSDLRAESDTLQQYWAPVFHPGKGAIVCHGTGLVQSELPPSPAAVVVGSGPQLVPGSEFPAKFDQRAATVYPLRVFTNIIHPFRNEVIQAVEPGPTLVRTDVAGTPTDTLLKIEQEQGPWFSSGWSANGEWIVYMKGRMFGGPETEADVWKMRPDGTNLVNLTPNSPGNDGFPGISADGQRIVFRSGRDGNYDIFLMHGDGSNPINLSKHPDKDAFPAMAPNGQSVVFSSNREGDLDSLTGERTYELYWLKLNPDGTPGTLKRLTNSPGQDAHSQFSPDGQWIIYASELGGINDEEPLIQDILFSPQMYGEICAMRLSDGKVIRLTHNKWEDGFPC